MRRKSGTLVPLEESILSAAIDLLRHGKEFHGYQIARHIADASDRRLLTAYGTLYRALGRLEAMGLVRSRWEDPRRAAEERRPSRRLYSLTDEGVEAARATRRARATASARSRKRRVAQA
jgi:DNA-binding PadR family transcriptional regulator